MNDKVYYLPNVEHSDEFPVDVPVLTVTVEGWGGQAMSGQLLHFDVDQRLVKIATSNGARLLSLKFNQVKRLKFQLHEATDMEFGPTQLPGSSQSEASSFAVFLRDSSVYSGICHRHHKAEEGLWLFPKRRGDSDPYRVFVPKSAIVRFEARAYDEGLISDTDFAHTMLQQDVVATDAVPKEPAAPEAPENLLIDNAESLRQALARQDSLHPVPIGQALLGLGKINQEQLDKILKLQKFDQHKPLGQLLLDKGLVTAADLQVAIARKMGYPFVDLGRFPVDPAALRQVPLALALRLQVLPLLEQGRSIVVAMTDPLRFKAIDELEFTTQRKVLPVVSASADMLERIGKAYRNVGLSNQAETASAFKSVVQPGTAAENAKVEFDVMQLAEELSDAASDEVHHDQPIEQSDNTLVRLINSMITEAYHQKASDIHIEPYPGREKLLIRFRVDGQMRPYLELPATYRNALVARIKIMCDLDISEKRKPQDGKINFAKFGSLAIELRVATIPTSNGLEDVVMRILSSAAALPLEQLNLSARNLSAFEAMATRPYGLILCVGPTGSGKTTTLHAALKHINTSNRKIWTAEDPVEITQKGLRQIQVNAKIGWTFAAALRSLLRADPDVIMVGEIRDHETAEMAIEASLTGHLVLSTLHTNSAAETVVRLNDLGIDPFSFADSLHGILAQRLVRRLCPHCVQSEPMDDRRLQELMLDYQHQMPQDHPLKNNKQLEQEWRERYGHGAGLSIKHASGCGKCAQTGYSGRVAVHELLVNSSDMRRLVQSRARTTEIQHQAMVEGMLTLRQDGITKVLQGLTSLAEVRSATVI